MAHDQRDRYPDCSPQFLDFLFVYLIFFGCLIFVVLVMPALFFLLLLMLSVLKLWCAGDVNRDSHPEHPDGGEFIPFGTGVEEKIGTQFSGT